jgi:DNA-binding beta-propeller fold protein YncE
LAAPALQGQTKPAPKPAVPSAGNGTMYIGSYKGVIFVVDEATEKVTKEIPVSVGIPTALTLSDDMSRIYVRDSTYEKIEVFDRVTGSSLGTFSLSDGKTQTRIWGMRPDPLNKTLILTIKNYTLEKDHWVIGPPTLVQYDLEQKKIVRTIPWPKGEEREGVGVLFSPDGKLLYMFSEDILIYETEKFTEVDRWQVSEGLRHSRTSRVSTRASSPCRTPCRTAASWAWDASSWPRKRSTSIRSARRAAWDFPCRRIASAATACCRASTCTSCGRSTSKTIG